MFFLSSDGVALSWGCGSLRGIVEGWWRWRCGLGVIGRLCVGNFGGGQCVKQEGEEWVLCGFQLLCVCVKSEVNSADLLE